MELSDLMVGDWVMYNPNVFIEDEYEPTKKEYPTQIQSGEDIGLAIEGCYKPIPITPEILDKNGFSDYDNAGAWRLFLADDESYYFGFSSVYYNTKDNFMNVVRENKKGAQNQCKGNYKYVHELQHALKLCGIEKEIIL